VRLGVVLLVNGENTLYRERVTPLACRKWIFDPDQKPFDLRGFKETKDGKGEEFKVL
jgi:hypothetical protein